MKLANHTPIGWQLVTMASGSVLKSLKYVSTYWGLPEWPHVLHLLAKLAMQGTAQADEVLHRLQADKKSHYSLSMYAVAMPHRKPKRAVWPLTMKSFFIVAPTPINFRNSKGPAQADEELSPVAT